MPDRPRHFTRPLIGSTLVLRVLASAITLTSFGLVALRRVSRIRITA